MKFELNNENMNQMKKKEAHQTDHQVLLKHQAVLESVLRKKFFFQLSFPNSSPPNMIFTAFSVFLIFLFSKYIT